MDSQIGKVAGLIWAYLNENGSQTMSKLLKGTKADKNLFNWGLGWLAREGKISIVKEKGKYSISLIK